MGKRERRIKKASEINLNKIFVQRPLPPKLKYLSHVRNDKKNPVSGKPPFHSSHSTLKPVGAGQSPLSHSVFTCFISRAWDRLLTD